MVGYQNTAEDYAAVLDWVTDQHPAHIHIDAQTFLLDGRSFHHVTPDYEKVKDIRAAIADGRSWSANPDGHSLLAIGRSVFPVQTSAQWYAHRDMIVDPYKLVVAWLARALQSALALSAAGAG